MQQVLNLVWDKLLPAFRPSPLADGDADAKLNHTLQHLALRLPEDAGSPAQVSGKKYVFAANDRKWEAVTLESGDSGVTIVLKTDGVEQRIACGHGTWQNGRLAWDAIPERPVAASGAWTADNTYTAKLCFYETPFMITLKLKFDGDKVHCQRESNVGFGPTNQPELVGKVE